MGSILGIVGVIPFRTSTLIGLVGLVLVLIGIKGIGDAFGDDEPFRYYLYSAILRFILVIIVVALATAMAVSRFVGFGSSIILLFVLFYIAILVPSYFKMKSLQRLSELTETPEFDSAATWIWRGAILTIVLIGVILVIVGWIYQALAFSRMPETVNPEKEEEG